MDTYEQFWEGNITYLNHLKYNKYLLFCLIQFYLAFILFPFSLSPLLTSILLNFFAAFITSYIVTSHFPFFFPSSSSSSSFSSSSFSSSDILLSSYLIFLLSSSSSSSSDILLFSYPIFLLSSLPFTLLLSLSPSLVRVYLPQVQKST